MISQRQSNAPRSPIPGEVVRRANDLYWRSGAGVNQLARELDLSKGALYDIIDPLPAGLPCPCGGGEMAYPNRTARRRGFVSCAVCGLEDEEERVREYLEERDSASAHELAADEAAPPPIPAEARAKPPTASGRRTPDKLLAASALVGLAAGLLLAGLLRRR